MVKVIGFVPSVRNFVSKTISKKTKILFLQEKVAPAVGIEPMTKVSYLVIKCHKVSYLVIKAHIVSQTSCQQLREFCRQINIAALYVCIKSY